MEIVYGIVYILLLNVYHCLPTGSVSSSDTLRMTSNDATHSASQMKIKQEQLEKELDDLKNEVSQLREIVRGQTDRKLLDGIDAAMKTRQGIHSRQKRSRGIIKVKRQPEVAFQAVLMHHSKIYRIKEAIKYDHVITNYAHAYNKENGVFTAPVSGTYFFSATIAAEKGNYFEASIQVNNEPKVTAVSDHRSTTKHGHKGWDQGSAVSVLRLSKGDQVTVAIIWPHGGHELSGMGKSSFCGYLLRSHERPVMRVL